MLTKKKLSQKQEKSVASTFSAKTVVASGALWGAKGDVRSKHLLIECKTTGKSHYSVTSKVWEKIANEAVRDGLRIPLLVVDVKNSDRLVVFNPKDFSTSLPVPYECSSNSQGSKQYSVSLVELDEINEDYKEYCYAKLFFICGKYSHLLAYMREKDFQKYYRKEIENIGT